ncbi:MAG: RNA methyltransferase [Candidatus Moduliflexus flocculans]|nr:RNA methyltransferase [Candidatus Moduliflexus flocculans]
MPTPERIQKVERVLAHRQADLRVVLEGITNAHNASAVMRTCDAAGVLRLDLIAPNPELLQHQRGHLDPGRQVARGRRPCDAGRMPSNRLRQAGFEIVATHLRPDAVPYTDVDFARPVALVFGNEAEGITEDCLAYADRVVRIPMLGMVQSLNLSVSVAVMLYEALRQRAAKGYGEAARLPAAEIERLRKQWLNITE